MSLSPSDLATLSLLDPEQGLCPNGHPCVLSDNVGDRECRGREYRGLALICWDITTANIDAAARRGADPAILEWARAFLGEIPS